MIQVVHHVAGDYFAAGETAVINRLQKRRGAHTADLNLAATHGRSQGVATGNHFGGQIDAIQGSVREPTYAGDTWIMADGCPSGYNGSTTGEGCVQCPVGTFLTDFFFLMTIIIFEDTMIFNDYYF